MSKSGLDIDLGNLCSKDAYNWAKTSFKNRQGRVGEAALKVDGAFANMLRFGATRLGIASDGIGTKIELAERTGIYHTLGFDLVAMVADDLATAGFEPVSISNIIDVDVLDRRIINELMSGLAQAVEIAGMSISGGEIAELGSRIGGYGSGMHFNWCSTAVGYLPETLDEVIDGSEVEAGQVVIALRSRGFRSNGFSLIRRLMQEAFGDLWHEQKYNASQTWGEALLTPCLIYCPVVNAWIQQGGLKPKGLAHITGGGILENFARALKVGAWGAVLDNLFEPLPVMQDLMRLGGVKAEEAYRYWNMGNGFLAVFEPEQAQTALEQAQALGYEARIAGRITERGPLRAEIGPTQLVFAHQD